MGNDALGKGAEMAGNALNELVKLGKESPEAREAGIYAAKSVKIIAQTIHTVLLPLAAANYGAQKFADYMRTKFGPELEERLKSVPQENIIKPRAVVAGPALDALVYAHEDDELRRLYLSLLASAMDSREAEAAHPAFVEVLRQIDSEEISYLRAVLRPSIACVPAGRFNLVAEDGESRSILLTHLLDWRHGGEPHVPLNLRRMAAYIENWVRLGLIEVDYSHYLVEPGAYEWMTQRPEYELIEARVEARENFSGNLEPAPGVLSVTSWGREFANAVRLDDAPSESTVRELTGWKDSYDHLVDDIFLLSSG